VVKPSDCSPEFLADYRRFKGDLAALCWHYEKQILRFADGLRTGELKVI
jgi:hypothetical protein